MLRFFVGKTKNCRKKFAKTKYIVYLCIGCRYNGKQYNKTDNHKTTMNTNTNALTEAVYYILLSLVEPMHGYGIMQQTAALSRGRLSLSAGTLYGALASLQEKGWIEPLPEEGRKKEYRLTDRGRTVLEAEIERLSELVENGKEILKIQTR